MQIQLEAKTKTILVDSNLIKDSNFIKGLPKWLTW